MKKKNKRPTVNFKKNRKLMTEYIDSVAETLFQTTDAVRGANRKELMEMIKRANLSEGDMLAVYLKLAIADALGKIMWAEFRLDNKDNEFGMAEDLMYDEEKDQIVIRYSPLDAMREQLYAIFSSNLFDKDAK